MTSPKRHREKGFSLIELLIVVAIILVIAAIAIPNFVRAKISANEASAVTSMHAIGTAEIGYSSLYPEVGFSPSLASLGNGGTNPCPGTPAASCFVDPALASSTKSGYDFSYVPDTSITPTVAFSVTATAAVYGLTGQTSYYSDQTNAIHYNATATAGPTDPTL